MEFGLYVALWIVFILVCWKVKDTPRNNKIAFWVFISLIFLAIFIIVIEEFSQRKSPPQPSRIPQEKIEIANLTIMDNDDWHEKYTALNTQVQEFLREHKRARRYFDDYNPN